MIETHRTLALVVEHRLDAVEALDELLHLGNAAAVLHVDVGDLVVRHRERVAGAGVEHVAPELRAHAHQACLAQRAIHVHRAGDRRDAVLRNHDHVAPAALGLRDELAAHRVHLLEILLQPRVREVGSEALQVVVEVRQVHQVQARAVAVEDVDRALRDPLRRADVRHRPPEIEQRKSAELAL